MLMSAFSIPNAHTGTIQSVSVLSGTDIPQILTGGGDNCIKVWNPATPNAPVSTVPTGGKVTHIEVQGSTVMWAANEPCPTEHPEVPVGMVYMSAGSNSIPLKRSDEMPYTHGAGDIRSFTVATVEGVQFAITAGGDGVIRTWRFDAASNKFILLNTLEGHVRAVTCLVLLGKAPL